MHLKQFKVGKPRKFAYEYLIRLSKYNILRISPFVTSASWLTAFTVLYQSIPHLKLYMIRGRREFPIRKVLLTHIITAVSGR